MYNGGSLSITSIGGPITSVTSNPNTTFTITNGSASQSFTARTDFKSITVNYTTATFATSPVVTCATPTFSPVDVQRRVQQYTIPPMVALPQQKAPFIVLLYRLRVTQLSKPSQ